MPKPNIYFASSISSANSKDHENAARTSEILRQHGRVMTELIGNPDIHVIETKNMANGVNISHRDLGWLADSDVMVADITNGSIGVGKEIGFALDARRIPVLAIHQTGKKVSQMVDNFEHPLLTNVDYASSEDLETQIDGFFGDLNVLGTLRPNLILCDGIDGCGKGVISKTLTDHYLSKGYRVFDAIQFAKDRFVNPKWEDVTSRFSNISNLLLLVAEPTHAEMGKIVREKLIKKENPYSTVDAAHGYALDRNILFNELVGPAIEAGVTVVLDRGVFATQVYQPVQGTFEGYDSEYMLGLVRGLPGNQEEMKYVPGLIILPDVAVSVAQSRLDERTKDDDASFERREFQDRIADVYASGRVEDWYVRRGSRIVHMPQGKDEGPEVTQRRTLEAFIDYMSSIRS